MGLSSRILLSLYMYLVTHIGPGLMVRSSINTCISERVVEWDAANRLCGFGGRFRGVSRPSRVSTSLPRVLEPEPLLLSSYVQTLPTIRIIIEHLLRYRF